MSDPFPPPEGEGGIGEGRRGEREREVEFMILQNCIHAYKEDMSCKTLQRLGSFFQKQIYIDDGSISTLSPVGR